MNKTVPSQNLGPEKLDRYLSPAVWEHFPIDDVRENPTLGIFFFDDFVDLPLAPTLTTQIAYGKYKAFNTGSGTINKVSAVNSVEIQGGAAQITLDTDNDSGSLAQAYPSFFMNGLAGTSGLLCAEFCYAQNSIATNMAAGFFGLAETELWTLATGVPFNGGDAITNSAAAIGFRIDEDGLGNVDVVYSDRATSFTEIIAGVDTLAANTFTKFGIRYDFAKPVDKRISFFVNNIVQTTYFTGAQLIALTNLDANALGLIWAHCADSGGTSFAGYMKWWACGQLQPGITGG